MMYHLILSHQAARDLEKVPRSILKRINASFDQLIENPFVGKKLHGEHAGIWSLRVWPYRILYTVQKTIVTVTVLRVVHRQGAYHK